MRLHECICTPTRVCIYKYMHTYTQTHIYAYTFIYTCTYTRIHAHTYIHTCTRTCVHRQKISATTPQRVKYHRRTYVSIYICMHIHHQATKRVHGPCVPVIFFLGVYANSQPVLWDETQFVQKGDYCDMRSSVIVSIT